VARLGRDLCDTRTHDSRTDNTDTLDLHGGRGYSPVVTFFL
jgi:hypothetical protein